MSLKRDLLNKATMKGQQEDALERDKKGSVLRPAPKVSKDEGFLASFMPRTIVSSKNDKQALS